MPEIRCSGTRFTDPITMEDCLACAERAENDCGYDYALLEFMYNQVQRRPRLHATDLVGCLLRSYWSKGDEQPAEYPHQMLMRSLGTITHGLLEGSDAEGAWTERTYEVNGVVGTVDKYYPDLNRIVDFKTTRWLKPSNLPYGSHEVQVNIYAYLMREHGHEVDEAYIQYIDLSGPTKCRQCKLPVVPKPDGLACPNCGYYPRGAHLGAVMFPADLMHPEEIKHFVEQRRDSLQLSLDMEDTPEAEPSFLCSYCKFLDQCREGLLHLGR